MEDTCKFYALMAPYLYSLGLMNEQTRLLLETQVNMEIIATEEKRRKATMKAAREEAQRKEAERIASTERKRAAMKAEEEQRRAWLEEVYETERMLPPEAPKKRMAVAPAQENCSMKIERQVNNSRRKRKITTPVKPIRYLYEMTMERRIEAWTELKKALVDICAHLNTRIRRDDLLEFTSKRLLDGKMRIRARDIRIWRRCILGCVGEEEYQTLKQIGDQFGLHRAMIQFIRDKMNRTLMPIIQSYIQDPEDWEFVDDRYALTDSEVSLEDLRNEDRKWRNCIHQLEYRGWTPKTAEEKEKHANNES